MTADPHRAPAALAVRADSAAPGARSAIALLALLARAALDLVLPVTCAGCGTGGVQVCPACAAVWSAAPHRCETGAARWPPPVWALAVHEGRVRRLLVAWKDGGRADLTGWLSAAGRRAGRWLAATGRMRVATGLPGARAVPDPPALLVVPAPPSASGARRRGEDLVASVARAVADGLSDGGLPATGVRVLRLRGGGPDQVGLGARGRSANRAGRVLLRRGGAARVAGRDVLLVDDVLTTGATLAECRRALEGAGARVRGAVVLVVTRSPGTRTGRLETPGDQG
jgi:predicted amidophosphoribosyltransferase